MASLVTATQRYLIQNIVRPVRYVMRKKVKFGAAWQMNTCRISLPAGRKGAERSTRSVRGITCASGPSVTCDSYHVATPGHRPLGFVQKPSWKTTETRLRWHVMGLGKGKNTSPARCRSAVGRRQTGWSGRKLP